MLVAYIHTCANNHMLTLSSWRPLLLFNHGRPTRGQIPGAVLKIITGLRIHTTPKGGFEPFFCISSGGLQYESKDMCIGEVSAFREKDEETTMHTPSPSPFVCHKTMRSERTQASGVTILSNSILPVFLDRASGIFDDFYAFPFLGPGVREAERDRHCCSRLGRNRRVLLRAVQSRRRAGQEEENVPVLVSHVVRRRRLAGKQTCT